MADDSQARVAGSSLSVIADDGHRFDLIGRIPDDARHALLWLPALGISARHYLPFADALARRGVAVFVHEWRGNGSSGHRAGRSSDWGYRELLLEDITASQRAIDEAMPGATRVIGGHSLGGQLAACRLALDRDAAQALWLVGSGSPYWRVYPAPLRFALPLAYRFMAWLAKAWGALPGRRIGFGGNEARTLVRDWSRTGMTGRYAAAGVDTDLESALRGVDTDVRAVVFVDDWLAPQASLRFLLSKLGQGQHRIAVLDARTLGMPADHYAWMKQPGAVADHLSK